MLGLLDANVIFVRLLVIGWSAVDQREIRRLILKALYSDEWLHDQLVLKGGNALALVYRVGGRSSLDLDFSIKGDFSDLRVVGDKIEKALRSVLSRAGLDVFDFALQQRPSVTTQPWWGGYTAEFKLISRNESIRLNRNLDQMRRQAITIDTGDQRRKYKVEISKFEYVEDMVTRTVDGVDVRVYSPVLIAIEKLRALVQQHPEYAQIPAHSKKSRSRDLYDIWAIADHFALKLEAHLPVAELVFEAKRVDLNLLARFRDIHDFHMADWADVENSVGAEIESFDFYFSFVESIADDLYAKWVMHAP